MGQLLNFRREVEAFLLQFDQSAITRREHYARNSEQPDLIRYVDLISARDADGRFTYVQASEVKSALHRFGSGNEENSKWVSAKDGSQEYVYRYFGSPMLGQFAQLTTSAEDADAYTFVLKDDRNVGTYNFAGANVDMLRHVVMDIHPWILWGNSAEDDSDPNWTRETRLTAFLDSIEAAIFTTLADLLTREEEVELAEARFNTAARVKIFGTSADDTFLGTDAQQRFVGRAGQDTVSYNGALEAVTVSLERSADEGQGFDGWARGDRFYGIENLTGTAHGDILIGNDGDNVLMGLGGRDIIAGRAGDDIIDGGLGPNELYGNRGDDLFYVYEDDTTVDGGQGDDTIITTISRFFVDTELYTGVEAYRLSDTNNFFADPWAIYGSFKSETLVGNWKDNELYGLHSGDTLIGGRGNDRLEGGRGNDTYVFEDGWGVDTIFEDGGSDTLEFLDRNKADLRLVRDIGVNSGTLRVFDKLSEDAVNISNHFFHQSARVDFLRAKDGLIDLRSGLEMEGTSGDDAILGSIHSDYIIGGKGKDTLRGDRGNDFLEGGDDNDLLEGGDGDDTYVFRPGFGFDTISESGRYISGVDSPGDTIAFWGITQAQVSSYRDTQGRQFIDILGLTGQVTDSIFIPAQAFNNGDGLLVEFMQFDGGGLIPIL